MALRRRFAPRAKVYAAFDPGSQRMGWAVGTGDGLPRCGAWRFDVTGATDVGAMLMQLDAALVRFFADHRPDVVAYERPLLLPHDTLDRLTKTYNLGGHLQYVCARRGVECIGVEVRAVKKELAGFDRAGKSDMIAAALKLGVELPQTKAEGREDAADALGVFLLLLRLKDRVRSQWFDRKLWSARGALL